MENTAEVREYYGIEFVDIVCDPSETWSQICEDCLTDEVPESKLSVDPTYSKCGVAGCHNDADYYIDF